MLSAIRTKTCSIATYKRISTVTMRSALTPHFSTSTRNSSISMLACDVIGIFCTGRIATFLCLSPAEVPFLRCLLALNTQTCVYSAARGWCCLQILRSFPTRYRISNSALQQPARVTIPKEKKTEKNCVKTVRFYSRCLQYQIAFMFDYRYSDGGSYVVQNAATPPFAAILNDAKF